jgi:hypothetical protein
VGHVKVACLAFAVLALTCCGTFAEEHPIAVEKTIKTPAGKFGIWKVSTADSNHTRCEYWLLFGRLGTWHIGATRNRPLPLLPIVFVSTIAAALVLRENPRNDGWQ